VEPARERPQTQIVGFRRAAIKPRHSAADAEVIDSPGNWAD
jgi:hypothetical protein